MVEEHVVTLWFNKEKPRSFTTLLVQQLKANSIGHTSKRQGDQIGIKWFHIISVKKGGKTNVRGVVGHIGRRIVLILLMPPLLTVILANHVNIVMHLGMMQIIVSHSIHNCGKVNPKLLRLAKVKVLGKKTKGQPIRGELPNQRKANPTPCKLGLHD